ncbi:regulatory protein RecX [Taibaiella chishuiensis]|uniref:Regulatory protein RecX n=1 Tax=Taibaiella chishuiensis TaxID=1434707 RepID=A0A2P8CYX7_9BACT|nr:regulatory protein RecX [Taibaiella chishuiensis]PSK90137.1 regulatory protein [Taibaiella chishuiensis]
MNLQAIKHFCAYQERCHSEVRSKLLELSFRGEALEEAISTLISEGFLNEERFARSYTGGKFRILKWGRRKIVQQLKLKQVSEYCIRKGLTEIDEADYYETLAGLAAQKLHELRQERSERIRNQKTIRYLVQKGYETGLILEVLQTKFTEGE